MKLINQDNGEILANHVTVANTFIKRLKGLMFTKNLPSGCALLIQPCQSVHTFFMNYELDILYLDGVGKVVAVDEQLKPGKIGRFVKDAKVVVEIPAGTIQTTSTRVNQVIQLTEKERLKC